MRWALVNKETNLVENVVIWDGLNDLFQNTTNVQLQENERCSIGWTYDVNGDPRFIEPVVEEIP
jgi:hypothetical protein